MATVSYENDLAEKCGILQDGRQITRARQSFVVRGLLTYYCTITIPNLNKIDAILDINIRNVSPRANVHGICDKAITESGGNPVVGFSIVDIPVGITHGGTTVTPEVVVIGW